MSNRHRAERMEEILREAISEILLTEFVDPRMPDVFTVSRVELTGDFQMAKVLFTQMPETDEAIAQTRATLERGMGFIRHELAQRVSMRSLPELRFYYDEQDRATRRVEELLAEARRTSPPPASAGPRVERLDGGVHRGRRSIHDTD